MFYQRDESLSAWRKRCGHVGTPERVQSALKTLYLSPWIPGHRASKWAVRWKPALNALAITFADRMPPKNAGRKKNPETPPARLSVKPARQSGCESGIQGVPRPRSSGDEARLSLKPVCRGHSVLRSSAMVFRCQPVVVALFWSVLWSVISLVSDDVAWLSMVNRVASVIISARASFINSIRCSGSVGEISVRSGVRTRPGLIVQHEQNRPQLIESRNGHSDRSSHSRLTPRPPVPPVLQPPTATSITGRSGTRAPVPRGHRH